MTTFRSGMRQSSDLARWRIIATLAIVVLTTVLSLVFEAKDGGNLDIYRRPLVLSWFLVTIVSAIAAKRSVFLKFIATAWWLQLFIPIAVVAIASACVAIYRPFHF